MDNVTNMLNQRGISRNAFIIITTVMGPIDVWIVCANMFIIIVLLCNHRSNSAFQVVQNLLIDLAIADFGLGAVVIPLALTVKIIQTYSHVSMMLCNVWISMDAFFSTASIINATTMVFDRYLVVYYPLRHKRIMRGYLLLLLVSVPWCISLLVSIPIFVSNSYFLPPFNYSPNDSETKLNSECSLLLLISPLKFFYSTVSFVIPCAFLIHNYTRVFNRLKVNASSWKSGVINSIDEKEQTYRTESKTSNHLTASNLMRVHIGGSPLLMKLKSKRKEKQRPGIYSLLPDTFKCGSLIVSASTHSKNKEPVLNREECKGDSLDENMTEHKDGLNLNLPRWSPFARRERNSDSNCTSIHSFRRCALMPLPMALQHSLSSEIVNSPKDNAGRLSPDVIVQADVAPAAASSMDQAPKQSKRDRNNTGQWKTNAGIVASCVLFLVGWFPFFFLTTLSIWLEPSETVIRVMEVVYYGRFLSVICNPFIYGSASGSLRKAFNHFIHCGRTPYEDKAIKRMVMASLGAAGLSYGRPIRPLNTSFFHQKSQISTKSSESS